MVILSEKTNRVRKFKFLKHTLLCCFGFKLINYTKGN